MTACFMASFHDKAATIPRAEINRVVKLFLKVLVKFDTSPFIIMLLLFALQSFLNMFFTVVESLEIITISVDV